MTRGEQVNFTVPRYGYICQCLCLHHLGNNLGLMELCYSRHRGRGFAVNISWGISFIISSSENSGMSNCGMPESSYYSVSVNPDRTPALISPVDWSSKCHNHDLL